jgi:predicted TIM-barrel fold metal-dependent hydrolase
MARRGQELLDWLAQVDEPVLEPGLRICDPHHHLWEFPGGQPGTRYLLDDLLADTDSGHNVVSTVFVECTSMYRADGPETLRPVGETEFVNGVAAMTASGGYGDIRACSGIVGLADLCLGSAVGEVLDAHAAASSRFRGIRHAAAWDASDEVPGSHTKPFEHMLSDATFREGIAELGKRGMSFDAWLYHPQIPELTDLARAFPDVTIILNHFGGPLGIGPYADKRAEVFEAWSGAISELATCGNVVVKMGGLVMVRNGFGFHLKDCPPTSEELAAATRDYYLHTIDCFGPERCMFESNFPVDRVSCSYKVLWNSFKRIAADFSDGDKAQLFHDAAVNAYRLNG